LAGGGGGRVGRMAYKVGGGRAIERGVVLVTAVLKTLPCSSNCWGF